MSTRCLARLTSWERTNSTIGTSNKRASFIKLCKNTPEKDKFLCQECSERPVEGKYQTRMMHGLLTEEPCAASHIYGSDWYWQQVSAYGSPTDTVWLEAAQKSQKDAEEFCLPTRAWKVQSPSAGDFKGMVKGKKEKDKAAATMRLQIKAKAQTNTGTLLAKFAPIHVIYEESAKVPEKLPTDSCTLWKDVLEGVDCDVWISAAGHVFNCDTIGEAGELIGMMVEGSFMKL